MLPKTSSPAVLAAVRRHPAGAGAANLGEVRADPAGIVILRTAFGGERIVDVLIGDPLPPRLRTGRLLARVPSLEARKGSP